MAWSYYQVFLFIVFLITGVGNAFLAKWQNRTSSVGAEGDLHRFKHPFYQTWLMFIAMASNYLVYKLIKIYVVKKDPEGLDNHVLTKGNREFNRWLVFIPALLDMLGTGCSMLGLTLTYLSSYQMLTGTSIVFTACLSVIFLHRIIKIPQWLGIFIIAIGLVVIGFADYINTEAHENKSTWSVLTGDALIICTDLLMAIKIVVEEKFLTSHDIPPLLVVGWEGIFGFISLSILFIPLYFIKVDPPFSLKPKSRIDDIIDAFIQVKNNRTLQISSTLSVLSIAFFNYAGISLVKEFSATMRMVSGCFRMLMVWIISLTFFGERFVWLQLVGFSMLMIGYFLYFNSDLVSGTVRKFLGRQEPVE